MSKERDWMDYAQLGLSAVQTAKMSEMAGEMGRVASETRGMREIAESQAVAMRDAHEAQERKAQQLKQVRQLAWMAEQFLTRLESDTKGETSVQGKYVYTFEIEAALKKAELIPPTALEHWEDMDRVGKLASRIEAFRETLLKVLTESQIQEAQLCWKYRAEDEDLSQLVERRSWLEERRSVLIDQIARYETPEKP